MMATRSSLPLNSSLYPSSIYSSTPPSPPAPQPTSSFREVFSLMEEDEASKPDSIIAYSKTRLSWQSSMMIMCFVILALLYVGCAGWMLGMYLVPAGAHDTPTSTSSITPINQPDIKPSITIHTRETQRIRALTGQFKYSIQSYILSSAGWTGVVYFLLPWLIYSGLILCTRLVYCVLDKMLAKYLQKRKNSTEVQTADYGLSSRHRNSLSAEFKTRKSCAGVVFACVWGLGGGLMAAILVWHGVFTCTHPLLTASVAMIWLIKLTLVIFFSRPLVDSLLSLIGRLSRKGTTHKFVIERQIVSKRPLFLGHPARTWVAMMGCVTMVVLMLAIDCAYALSGHRAIISKSTISLEFSDQSSPSLCACIIPLIYRFCLFMTLLCMLMARTWARAHWHLNLANHLLVPTRTTLIRSRSPHNLTTQFPTSDLKVLRFCFPRPFLINCIWALVMSFFIDFAGSSLGSLTTQVWTYHHFFLLLYLMLSTKHRPIVLPAMMRQSWFFEILLYLQRNGAIDGALEMITLISFSYSEKIFEKLAAKGDPRLASNPVISSNPSSPSHLTFLSLAYKCCEFGIYNGHLMPLFMLLGASLMGIILDNASLQAITYEWFIELNLAAFQRAAPEDIYLEAIEQHCAMKTDLRPRNLKHYLKERSYELNSKTLGAKRKKANNNLHPYLQYYEDRKLQSELLV